MKILTADNKFFSFIDTHINLKIWKLWNFDVNYEIRFSLLNPSLISVSSSISIPLRYICLGVLVIQTSTNILTLRYSRTRRVPGQPVYIAATAVFCSEILKLFLSYLVLLRNSQYKLFQVNSAIHLQIRDNWRDGIKLGVPAVMYVVQNNLLFLALTKLDAATYQVYNQLNLHWLHHCATTH